MGLESEKIPTGPFKSPAVQTAAPFSPGLVGVDHGHTWLGVIRRFDVRFDGLKSGEVPLEGVWKNGPFKGAGSHFVGKTKWFIYVFYSCKYTWYMMIQIIVYIYICFNDSHTQPTKLLYLDLPSLSKFVPFHQKKYTKRQTFYISGRSRYSMLESVLSKGPKFGQPPQKRLYDWLTGVTTNHYKLAL